MPGRPQSIFQERWTTWAGSAPVAKVLNLAFTMKRRKDLPSFFALSSSSARSLRPFWTSLLQLASSSVPVPPRAA